MALLNRLFSTRKKSPKSNYAYNGKYDGESWRPFSFNKEQVRVLLFRECDWRGRKLLFDSNSILKVPNEKSSRSKLKFGGRPKVNAKNLSSVSNSSCYQFTKPGADVSMLGEMIFGSVGMTFKGSAFKVHRIKSTSQLMCSKVFLSPRCHRKHLSSDRSLDDSCDSSLNVQGESGVPRSSSDNRLASRTGPLDVPWSDTYSTLYPPGSSYIQPSEEDSGFCGDTSLLSVNESTSSGYGLSSGCGNSWGSFGQSIGHPSSNGSGSLQSMQRRWLRSLHTSIELFCQNPSMCTCCSVPVNPAYLSGNTSIDGVEENSQGTSSVATLWGRRPKIGIAVIVTLLDPHKEQLADKNGLSEKEEEKLSRESFFFEHISVVEEMLDRLRLATEKACHSRKDVFIPLIMDACAELEQSLTDLFSGPRLSRPVWLGLLAQNGVRGLHHSTIALGFLEQLCQSISTLDTKATNFFISTLITAVLTHHLGWVHTVQPQMLPKKEPYTNDYSLEGLSNSYPYNTLWAQLGDLQGNLGYPPRLARTILTGKDSQVLNSLLFILTYFMRCSRVECLREDGPIEEEGSPAVMSIGIENSNEKLNVPGEAMEMWSRKKLGSNSSIRNPQSSLSSVPIGNCGGSDNLLHATNLKEEGGIPKGLRRTSSHVSNLGDSMINPNKAQQSTTSPELDAISEKVQRLCRVPKSAILYHLKPSVSCESVPDRNGYHSSSDVVFVLGENEKLVGLKSRVPPLHTSDDVMTAEEVTESERANQRGGKVALGDQITALAGEFISRCKEGIRLAGRAADSIGVVGGRTNLHMGTGTSYTEGKEVSRLPSDFESFKQTYNFGTVEGDSCSKSTANYYKNCRVGLVSDKSDFLREERASNNNCCSKEFCGRSRNAAVENGSRGDFENVLYRQENFSTQQLPEIRTEICDNVQESFSENKEHNKSMANTKPESLEGLCDIFPLIDMSELPSFDGIVTVELPMPRSVLCGSKDEDYKFGVGWGLASSLLGATSDHYVPHNVLQGICSTSPNSSRTDWENLLRRDLALSVQYPVHHFHPYSLRELSCSPFPVVAEPEIVEAVCVVGNLDKWEVQVVSSRPCLVDRPGTLGVQVGMSQLVANMLESLLILWRLRTPPEYCLLHLESKLREIWLRSQSLAQLLLTTEFCNMARVTSSLDLEANDVPLLLAVASTHTPQVTLRYGLSFR